MKNKEFIKVILAIIIFIVVVVPVTTSASLVGMTVKKIYTVTAAKVGTSIKIPAIISTAASSGAVQNIATLTLTGAQIGGIAGATMALGGGIMLYRLNPEWFDEKDIQWTVASGARVQDQTWPVNADIADYYSNTGTYAAGGTYKIGYSTSCPEQRAKMISFCESVKQAGGCSVGNMVVNNCILTMNMHVYVVSPGNAAQFFGYCYNSESPSCNAPPETQSNQHSTPLETGAIADELAADLDADNPAAWGLAKTILDHIKNMLDHPTTNFWAKNPAYTNTVNDELLEGLSDSAANAIDGAAANATDAPVIPIDPADAYTGVTPADITNAIREALQSEGLSAEKIAETLNTDNGLTAGSVANAIWSGAPNTIGGDSGASGATANAVTAAANAIMGAQNAAANQIYAALTGPEFTEPVDPQIEAPDKESLTAVLSDFVTSLNTLPIMQTLNGMQISSAGSSSLCVNLPAAYGGSRCQNFGNIAEDLNNVGSVMLSILTLMMAIYLFKGN